MNARCICCGRPAIVGLNKICSMCAHRIAVRAVMARIDKALTELDFEECKKIMFEEHGAEAPADPEVVWTAMHKARIERTGIGPALRLESVEWLRARGYARRGGLPLPPPGELPE